jgi:hypothetical protein
LRKQIAGALVACLFIGSTPGWAAGQEPTTKPTAGEGAQSREFRDSIDRAMDRAVVGVPEPSAAGVPPRESDAPGPQLTAHERQDLEARSAALKTDPVARGTGSVVMLVLGAALTVGATMWAINKSKEDSTTVPTMGMR